MVNLVRGFPSHCGKPIGFSIVAALSMPRSEGEKGVSGGVLEVW